jgi:hypothetical protein
MPPKEEGGGGGRLQLYTQYREYKKKVIELQRAIIRESLGVWTIGFHIRKDQAFSYWMTYFSYISGEKISVYEADQKC